MTLDKVDAFFCLSLVTLFLIIFYIFGLSQPPSVTPVKVDSGIPEELTRFQGGVNKFVKSLGDMEERLHKLEDNVQQIQKKQETFHGYQRRNNLEDNKVDATQTNVKQRDVDEAHKRELGFQSFVGEIKRDNYCFDSAEHKLGGVLEIWKCHKEGRNQEFQTHEGTITHKQFCLAVKKAEEGESVILKECDSHDSIIQWQYHDSLIKAENTNYCMMNKSGSGKVTLAHCNAEDKSQQWQLESA